MKFSILSDWVCACVCAFYDNSFVLEKFIYLICTLSRLLPHPLYMCVCVREANKNYVKTCKYALTFDLWMTNDTPLAHVRQLLIMITLVTVSFVVNNGLVPPRSPLARGGHWAQMKIDSLRLIEYVSLLLFLGRRRRLRCQLIEKV